MYVDFLKCSRIYLINDDIITISSTLDMYKRKMIGYEGIEREKKAIVYTTAIEHHHPDLDVRKIMFGNDDYPCPRKRTKK